MNIGLRDGRGRLAWFMYIYVACVRFVYMCMGTLCLYALSCCQDVKPQTNKGPRMFGYYFTSSVASRTRLVSLKNVALLINIRGLVWLKVETITGRCGNISKYIGPPPSEGRYLKC